MSKVLSVENGNYIIKVKSGNNIILDTSRGEVDNNGDLVGEVVINGGLLVRGTTTTVNSQNTNIKDNIIVLNKYDDQTTGVNGVIDNQSGIEIDRGGLPRVRMVFDETITWEAGGVSGNGTFTFENDDYGFPLPIYVGGIKSPGTLYIDVSNEVISVTNSVAYEQQVWNYVGNSIVDNGNDAIINDDFIPNARAVVDYINYAFNTIGTGAVIQNFDTDVVVYDFEQDGSESRAETKIDGQLKFAVYSDRVETETVKLQNSTISPMTVDTDLILEAPGVASVKINDVLEITKTPHADDIKIDPFAPVDGIKLYSKQASTGNTGLFYINENEQQDEIISKNRAILYSMIF
tara:strand:- start:4517 stop:5560 length:1044 start_codon:yes stop_codon:yes gene_type:complete